MEIGLVHKIDINQEMQQAYLDYAMSVIVSRALPDARDGLKPVHRRILYAMYDMGLRAETPYKKSARIVGEVLGKYHPHGDAAVYEAMSRMAQDFSMRYLLVEGQGNFGSIDGDPPAAMRYTEARLARPAMDILADIQKNTIDFNPNFDGTLTEPSVLPAAMPNLLVNGASGIAVGMATSIPPHNLGEVAAAIHLMLERWERLDDVSVEDLMQHVKGPDFPTGGVLVHSAGSDGLVSAYSTGRGAVTVQARAHVEEMDRGRSRIIVTELPYMTNKSSLIERIAELAREGKLEGISDLRDESDRQGMRIVIELSKSVEAEKILAGLYKHTPMQSTFSIIMLALVEGEPRLLSLKQALKVYIEHRLEIIRRRSTYDLEKARARAHILEGLRVALKNLDEVIDIIRKAPDVDTARLRLIKRFKLSEIQAQAILDMPLRRLAALERKKIEEEYKELQAQIKELESLLRSPRKMREVIGETLDAVTEAYGDRRRTQIVTLQEGQSRTSPISAHDMTPQQDVWVSVTAEGLISRTHEDHAPRLSGKDAPMWLVRANTRDTLYLASETGEAAAMPVHVLPENEDPGQGTPFERATPLKDGHKLAALFAVPPRKQREAAENAEQSFILTVTRGGMVKKSGWDELPGPSAGLFTLVKVNEGDRLFWAGSSQGQSELLLATAGGMAIRFSEDEVRPMGLAAAGVLGVRLAPGDQLVGAELLPKTGDVLLAASTGKVKRVPVDEFPRQGRYGQGVQAWKLAVGESLAGMAVAAPHAPAVLHLNRLQPKSFRADEAPLQTRAAKGSSLIDLKAGDFVTSLIASIPPTAHKGEAKPRKPAPPASDCQPPAAPVKAKPAAKTTAKAKAAPAEAVKPATKAPAKAKAVPAEATKPAAKTPAKAKAVPAEAAKTPAKAKAATAEAAKTPAKAKAASAEAPKPATKTPAKAKSAPAEPTKPAAKTPAKAVPAEAAKPAAKTPAKAKAAAPAEPAKPATKPPAKAKAAPAEDTKPASKSGKAKPASDTQLPLLPAVPTPKKKKP